MSLDPEGRLEVLWNRHRVAVSAYLLRRTDPETAKDALSETFSVAWRRLDDVPDDALPWLLGVARKVLANHRRGARRRRALDQRLRAQPHPASHDPDLLADQELALRALGALRPGDRELLMLVAWDGLRPAEAAEALGISAARFSVRLHRARRRLASALQAQEPAGHEPYERRGRPGSRRSEGEAT